MHSNLSVAAYCPEKLLSQNPCSIERRQDQDVCMCTGALQALQNILAFVPHKQGKKLLSWPDASNSNRAIHRSDHLLWCLLPWLCHHSRPYRCSENACHHSILEVMEVVSWGQPGKCMTIMFTTKIRFQLRRNLIQCTWTSGCMDQK